MLATEYIARETSSTGHFSFAAIFFAMAVFALIHGLNPRSRQAEAFQGGIQTSTITRLSFILMYFVWATVSLGWALQWNFLRKYELGMILNFSSSILVAACFGFDWIKRALERKKHWR